MEPCQFIYLLLGIAIICATMIFSYNRYKETEQYFDKIWIERDYRISIHMKGGFKLADDIKAYDYYCYDDNAIQIEFLGENEEVIADYHFSAENIELCKITDKTYKNKENIKITYSEENGINKVKIGTV